MCRRSAPSLCSDCPTSRFNLPTTSPTTKPSNGSPIACRSWAALPNGAQPQISPTSPIGEIYRYRVVGPPNYSVTDLKTLEDWVLERRFKAVPGVIDVTGWGGKTKTYDIAIDQHKLMAYGLSVPQVLAALGNANINVGGQTVNFGAQAAVVRGVGLIHSADEIRHTLIASNQGAPVVIGDVAKVSIGNLPRLGIAGYNDVNDIVQGIVLMRRGAESVPTIKRVEAEVDLINKSGILPPGVSIQRIYDRSDLINLTTHTVLHNMVAGIVLIFLLQWAFLGNLRSAIIVAMTIPFALSFAIGLMVLRGESANLLSVGAIDFGLVVDATVIMVENIFRHLAEASAHRVTGPSQCTACACRAGFAARWAPYRSPPPRSVSRFSSPRRSSSRASYRCSRCRGSKATYSGRWRRPMHTRSRAA